MNKYDFPKMFKASYSYLKTYDFIYDAKFDKKMSDCYNDIIENSEDYIEIFANLGYELEINPDRGFVHVVCFVNKNQNYVRALKACAIAYWLSKVASENTLLVNGEIVPGNRFTETELEEALDDNLLREVTTKNSKIKLVLNDIKKYGLLEEVPGGTDSHREYVLTGAYQYYIEFAKKISFIIKGE